MMRTQEDIAFAQHAIDLATKALAGAQNFSHVDVLRDGLIAEASEQLARALRHLGDRRGYSTSASPR